MTKHDAITDDAFRDHVAGLMRDIRSRYPQASLSWTGGGELLNRSGSEPIVEMRWGLIRGHAQNEYRARMLVDRSASAGLMYLVSPPGDSVVRVAPVEDREHAIEAFLDLVEPGR